MGWIRSLYHRTQSQLPFTSHDTSDKEAPTHVEQVEQNATTSKGVARIASAELLAICLGDRSPVDSHSLPFIPPEEVEAHNSLFVGIWIVVDDKVYDCTHFRDIHPGGSIFFEQFAGKQCTWQFWRYHSQRHLSDWSPALLIGYTYPVPPNPYKEPPRWIKTS